MPLSSLTLLASLLLPPWSREFSQEFLFKQASIYVTSHTVIFSPPRSKCGPSKNPGVSCACEAACFQGFMHRLCNVHLLEIDRP